MRWLNRNPKQYQPDELVRLVTTNDENVMHQATPPLWLTADRRIGRRPYTQRVVGQVTTSGPDTMRVNYLRWPRPTLIPAELVPGDFDGVSEVEPGSLSEKYVQQTAENYLPALVSENDARRFNQELWPKRSYRWRCRVWSLWQMHLKDWWFFIRYPLAYGTALALAIATIYHLSLSHPSPSP